MSLELPLAHHRIRLLDALQKAPVSTVYAREVLDIQTVAARIMELRRTGHTIITTKDWVTKANGKRGKFGIYTLLPNVEQELRA